MNVEVEIIKELPKKQILGLEDRVVYNTAVLTREYTKNANAYPYLSGELQRSEIAAPITGSNKEYGLLSGVDYAKYVWKYNNAVWTNPSTQPKWYYTTYKNQSAVITQNALVRALKEI